MSRLGWLSAAWIALFSVNALGILPVATLAYPTVDLAQMVYEVRRLGLGYVPYRDTFSHHFAGYLFPFYLLDSVIALTPPVLKVTSICFNFVCAVCVFWILRETARREIAWLGAFLTVTVGWFWGWQGFAFNVQSYLTPIIGLLLLFTVVTCNRVSASAFVAAGLCAGLLLTFDQRAAPFGFLLVIPPLAVPVLRSPRILAATAIATATAPGLALFYLWQTGAWSDFVMQTIEFPLYYRNYGLDPASTSFGSWLSFGFSTDRPVVTLMLLGLGAMILLDPRRWFKAVMLVSIASAVFYAVSGGRLYNNYLLTMGPNALVLMGMLAAYAPRFSTGLGMMVVAGLCGLGVYSGIVWPLKVRDDAAKLFAGADATVVAAADYLRTNTEARDPVLVWGFAPQIYVLSDRFNTFKDDGLMSVTGGNFDSSSPAEQGRVPAMVQEFERFLRETPPNVIVIYQLMQEAQGPCYGKGGILKNLSLRDATHFGELRKLIAESYHLKAVYETPCDRAEILAHTRSEANDRIF